MKRKITKWHFSSCQIVMWYRKLKQFNLTYFLRAVWLRYLTLVVMKKTNCPTSHLVQPDFWIKSLFFEDPNELNICFACPSSHSFDCIKPEQLFLLYKFYTKYEQNKNFPPFQKRKRTKKTTHSSWALPFSFFFSTLSHESCFVQFSF